MSFMSFMSNKFRLINFLNYGVQETYQSFGDSPLTTPNLTRLKFQHFNIHPLKINNDSFSENNFLHLKKKQKKTFPCIHFSLVFFFGGWEGIPPKMTTPGVVLDLMTPSTRIHTSKGVE